MNDNNYPKQTIGDRLQLAVRQLKKDKKIVNQIDLAKKMGLSPITVSRALNGYFNGDKFAKDLNSFFGYCFSLNWLLYGEGSMMASEEAKSAPKIEQQPSPPDPVPPWASVLIDLVSQNTKTIEGLHRDNESLRQQLTDMTNQISALRKAVSTIQYSNTNNPTMLTAAEKSNNHDD